MLIEILAVAALMQDSTTVCRPFGGQTTCETTRNPTGLDAYTAARAASNPEPARPPAPGSCAGNDWLLAGCTYGAHREAREAREAQARERQAAVASTNLRQTVAAYLERGMCQEAVTAALRGGDVDLATQARSFCAVPASTQP